MKYIYINAADREIFPPQKFNTLAEAQAEMRKDFLNAIGEDAVKETLENENIDLTADYYTCDNFEISETAAWANDAFRNHENWDGKIFEMQT